MKLIIITVLLLAKLNSFAQRLDTLSNYSYLIKLTSITGTYVATGFILNRNNKFYFVTAYHVAAGYIPKNHKHIPINNLNITISKKSEIPPKSFNLPPDISKKELEIFDKLELPDISIYEISKNQIDPSIKLFDISLLIDTAYFDRKPNKIIVFGYPVNLSKFPPDYVLDSSKFVSMPKNIWSIKPATSSLSNEIFAQRYDKQYFMSTDSKITNGYSGAPVFGVFKNNKKNVIKFIGVVSGAEKSLSLNRFTKARPILNEINSFVNKK